MAVILPAALPVEVLAVSTTDVDVVTLRRRRTVNRAVFRPAGTVTVEAPTMATMLGAPEAKVTAAPAPVAAERKVTVTTDVDPTVRKDAGRAATDEGGGGRSGRTNRRPVASPARVLAVTLTVVSRDGARTTRTWKSQLLLPAGTVTVAGRTTSTKAGSLDASVSAMPPVGATPIRATRTVAVEPTPRSALGVTVTDLTEGGAGTTVTIALARPPVVVAVNTTRVDAGTE